MPHPHRLMLYELIGGWGFNSFINIVQLLQEDTTRDHSLPKETALFEEQWTYFHLRNYDSNLP